MSRAYISLLDYAAPGSAPGWPNDGCALRNNTAPRSRLPLLHSSPDYTPPTHTTDTQLAQRWSKHSPCSGSESGDRYHLISGRPRQILQVNLRLAWLAQRKATQERRPSIGSPRLRSFQRQSGLGSRAKNINSTQVESHPRVKIGTLYFVPSLFNDRQTCRFILKSMTADFLVWILLSSTNTNSGAKRRLERCQYGIYLADPRVPSQCQAEDQRSPGFGHSYKTSRKPNIL